MKEIEILPEEYAGEVLDFEVKSMFGVFPGISTNVEREEMDRVGILV
jgi:hypothetical protein